MPQRSNATKAFAGDQAAQGRYCHAVSAGLPVVVAWIPTVVDSGAAHCAAIDIPHHLVAGLGLMSVRSNEVIQ